MEFIQFVLNELKANRITKKEAVELIGRYKNSAGTAAQENADSGNDEDFEKSGKPRSNSESWAEFLKNLVCDITKIPSEKLDVYADFETLGFDSVIIAQLNERIGRVTGELNAAILFKYKTIRELIAYLADKYDLQKRLKSSSGQDRQTKGESGSAIKTLQSEDHKCVTNSNNDIAVVGIAGRFPCSASVDELWDNICGGRDCITEIPADRWNMDGFYEPDKEKAIENGQSYCKWGGFIDGAYCFDPRFFKISPREAMFMDPQERLFLESAWSCIEDAGYTRKSLKKGGYGNRIGVFAGASFNNYQLYMAEAAASDHKRLYSANSQTYSIANRVSYFMDFTGPSLTIDTACSSSLCAIHLACESIHSGQSCAAIAGGVNLSLHPSKYIMLSNLRFCAEDGRCHAFSEGGTGYVPAECVGTVFLKPLLQAVADGDHIYGVIKGTASSHDGKTNGYTVPNPVSQSLVIEKALEAGHINPRTITCIEAHGTGTVLGDPIEIEALTDVFNKFTSDTCFCSVSSVKSNIGHAEAAAGVAQVTKVLLQMKHKTLVKNLMHGKGINPNLNLKSTPFFIPKENMPWDRPVIDGKEVKRRAGISSFGAGGSNVHIVVEEYDGDAVKAFAVNYDNAPALIVLSAHSEKQLTKVVQNLSAFLTAESFGDGDLINIAYTLQTGREAMEFRIAFAAFSLSDLKSKLDGFLNEKQSIDLFYRGQAAKEKTEDTTHLSDNEKKAYNLYVNKNYGELLEMWVCGFNFDWKTLYKENVPNRISLPTYPFACDEFRINQNGRLCIQKNIFPEDDSKIGEAALFEPVFEERLAINGREHVYGSHSVILCGFESNMAESVKKIINGISVDIINKPDGDIGDRFQAYSAFIFEWIKKEISKKNHQNLLLQVIVPLDGENMSLCGISGLLKTAEKENQRLVTQLVGVEKGSGSEALIRYIKENMNFPDDDVILYRNDTRLVRGWSEVKTGSNKTVWKDNGIYLITGGAGGLGIIFAEEITKKAACPTLILTGRSEPDRGKLAAIEKLRQMGAYVRYVKTDVTNKEAVNQLIHGIHCEFGRINGIIHAAGIIRDNYIIKKSTAELYSVMAPKVKGLVNLDEAVGSSPLDYFILFSSVAGTVGNVGQADYAAANAFMDAYAQYRNALNSMNKRKGLTTAVNWPLWENGGMKADAQTKTMLFENSGITTLGTQSGISALYSCINSGKNQIMVLSGDKSKIKEALLTKDFDDRGPSEDYSDKAYQNIVNDILNIISDIILSDINEIDISTQLQEYGFDSITFTELANKINKAFGTKINATAFFEYTTVKEIAQYLVSAVKIKQVERNKREPDDKLTAEGYCLKNEADAAALAAQENTYKCEGEPIAVIGMSGVFPMAEDINQYWKNLINNKDCITEIPKERWDWREFYGDPEKEPGKTNIKWGGFIDGIDEFDPLFFGISPREAELMDPQQRLLMIHVWKALEDAGYSAKGISGTDTGIFAGTWNSGYSSLLTGAGVPIESYSGACMVSSVGPGRMSWFLNIHGPSEPVETACSSSLVAVHRAVESIRRGECGMAIAGGVNTIITKDLHISLNRAGMLSEDGRCKTFSDKANGFVRGEGAAMIVLKKLSEAQKSGDNIYGVILSTAENHGGRSGSLTAPNPAAQAALLKEAYNKAGIDPGTVTYIEAHGTGTRLGDPIEINALKAAFAELYAANGTKMEYGRCGLGSAKSNIGHLEIASGAAGLIKVLLQMKYKTLVKSLHCDTVNPYIELDDSPFYIVRENKEWTALKDAEGKPLPRRAGISSFGFGGVNAHIVLEEYIPENRTEEIEKENNKSSLIVLSAKNQQALRRYVKNLRDYLVNSTTYINNNVQLSDLAYTLQTGREPMPYRFAAVDKSITGLIVKLDQFCSGNLTEGVFCSDFINKAIDKQDFKNGYISSLLKNCDLEKLGAAFIKGADIDWKALYSGKSPHKVSLPTYPFEKRRCWFSAEKKPDNDYNTDKSKNKSVTHPATGNFNKSTRMKLIIIYEKTQLCSEICEYLQNEHKEAETFFVDFKAAENSEPDALDIKGFLNGNPENISIYFLMDNEKDTDYERILSVAKKFNASFSGNDCNIKNLNFRIFSRDYFVDFSPN